MESEPFTQMVILSNLSITFFPFSAETIAGIIIAAFLLLCLAIISGSEVAFVSLGTNEIEKLKGDNQRTSKATLQLILKPQELKGTVAISKILISIAIILIINSVITGLINFSQIPITGFLIQLVLISFVLLVFGDIIPKICAAQNPVKALHITVLPINLLFRFFSPMVKAIILSSKWVDNSFHRKNIDANSPLTNAIEISAETLAEGKEIVKGIMEYGNIEVKDIMCPRVDVLAVHINTPFTEVIKVIVEAGYSRIPVYTKTFDDVKGILFIKDLIPHIHKSDSFHWQSLIRPPYAVPERKKINELLDDLQKKKIHMAIVVDEYGGTSGIITMEDIIEEIVGDMSDEFDEDDEIPFSKINENSFLFDGKILLNDFFKIMDVEPSVFDEIKGNADTLAGLILEIRGDFPHLHEIIKHQQFTFIIEALDNRRIVKIKTTINR